MFGLRGDNPRGEPVHTENPPSIRASDSAARAVEPALRELGLEWSNLDYLINTHGHKDHAGGNGR